VAQVRVGDTITDRRRPAGEALPGYKVVHPMVFTGLFPTEGDKFEELRDALEKLKLNDAALLYEPESSVALGFGFRCGFLGLLHMDIVRERLEREFALGLIGTAPTVVFRVMLQNRNVMMVDNPVKLPPLGDIEYIEEPVVLATIHAPSEYVGNILKLCEERRGEQQSLAVHAGSRAVITYEMPLNEIVLDFYDKLKSYTRGYASFDYEFSGYRPAELVKLDIKLNGENVDALSVIVHKDKAYSKGRALCEKLKELIDRQMFEVAIQAAVGSKVISRSTVKPLRKNVTAKCYGGDVTRKRKLLEKQKAGKKRMKEIGSVSIPQEAFLAVLKIGEE